MTKVAVYTIALNEEQFVERWYESAKDADYLLIADTGSTDGTVEAALALGINVINIKISPWRFDDARNAALAALPADIDYCIALDMDEVLIPGWGLDLDKVHAAGVTRPRYQYTWNWTDPDETKPGLQYGGDKIHTRNGYRWKHPVHEVLVRYGSEPETQQWIDLEIHHHPDNSKPRSQYLPLLAQAVKEDPYDDRNAFYYARELYFYGKYSEAAEEFKRHLELPRAVWRPERAASMRYLAKCEPANKEEWLIKAHIESPERREALVELAQHFYSTESWASCLHFAEKALSIKTKPLDYLCEDFAWGYLPHDLAAIASYWEGYPHKAKEYGQEALNLNPEEPRLEKNMAFYTSK
jgi:glycosyltransferase involved in cell wall biosynthesis